MWLERFIIVVPGLARKQSLSFSWYTYAPSSVEVIIVAGTFGLVLLGVLMFSKLFPLIPLYDEKEGQRLRDEIQIGRVKVPAVFHEE
jgi:molybdopterin-containing oxidoreductase family membrane subunit